MTRSLAARRERLRLKTLERRRARPYPEAPLYLEHRGQRHGWTLHHPLMAADVGAALAIAAHAVRLRRMNYP